MVRAGGAVEADAISQQERGDRRAAVAELRRRVALRVEGEPRAAELRHVVAEDLTPGVVDVEVERLPLVGHLPPAVAALDGAKQVAVDAAAGAGTALGEEGRPGLGTGPVAAGLVARVAGEEVKGAVVAIEENGPELRVPKRDEGTAPGGGGLAFSIGQFVLGSLASSPVLGIGARRTRCGLRGRGLALHRSPVALVVISAGGDQCGAGDQCYEEACHVTGLQRVAHRGSRDGGDSLRTRKGRDNPDIHHAYDTIGLGYTRVRRQDPRIAARIRAALGDARTVLNAYWRRPAAYLDAEVRAGISVFSLLSPEEVEEGLARLSADLHTGEWYRRNAAVLELEELDLGYRLVVAGVE